MSVLTIYILVVTICLFTPFVKSTEQYTIVNTNSGTVRGKTQTTLFENKDYYAFKGIPYAKPPVQKLRFKVIHVSPLLIFNKFNF